MQTHHHKGEMIFLFISLFLSSGVSNFAPYSKQQIMTIKPYNQKGTSKKQEVANMFNTIAPHYDLLNHLLSLGIDKIWRKKTIKLFKQLKAPYVLDVATGTGDMAIKAHQILDCDVVGVDISTQMLEIAEKKILKKYYHHSISVQEADSENLPFKNETFDAVMVAFGVRNFENLDKGLQEMARVLKKDGLMAILEFSKPTKFPIKQLYLFYFTKLLPFMGGLISKDREAYSYLPQSVLQFPDGAEFENHLKTCGMTPVKRTPLTLGIATIYLARK